MEPWEKEQQTSPAAGQEPGGDGENGHFFSDLMDIAEAGVLTVFIFLLVFIFLIRRVTVDGGSMNPTLIDKDQILILMSLYEPKNGQIVVLDDKVSAVFWDEEQTQVAEKNGSDMILVKRLIAKGGQTIDIDASQGTVKVDGVLLDEPYIADPTTVDDGAFHYPMTVPEGYIFVMGDNRLYSMDSRSPHVALIPESEILGTALLRYDREKDLRTKWTERFDFLF